MVTGLKVALYCFVCSGVGALAGREWGQDVWGLQALIGGAVGLLTGYLSWDFKQVCQAVPVAWRGACEVLPSWEYFRRVASFFSHMSAIVVIAFSNLLIPLLISTFSVIDPIPPYIILSMLVMLMGVFFVSIMIVCVNKFIFPQELAEIQKNARFVILRVNPIAVFGYWLPKGLFWVACFLCPRLWKTLCFFSYCIVSTPSFLAAVFLFSCRFCWHLFKIIHSQCRLLVGIDAAIGAAIGAVAPGSVLVWALIGGLWGWLNYELISIRWLKLAPKT